MKRQSFGWPVVPRRAVRISLDILAWWVGVTLASLFRVDFDAGELSARGQVLILPVVAICHLAASWATGLYAGKRRFGTIDEVAAIARTTFIATAAVFTVDYLASHPRMVPLTATLGGGILAFLLMGGTRYLWRYVGERRRRPAGEHLVRVLVFGAGEGGAQVVASMLRDPASPYVPVALLDDDPDRQRLQVSGVPVVGTRDALVDAASTYEAKVLLIAIPSAGRDLIGALTEGARASGLEVKVLPTTRELLGGVGVGDIRDLTPGDILGRREIAVSTAEIAGYLQGRRVLVVGAGGSIGSELCRQIVTFRPAELLMLDRDESALHAVELSMRGRATLDHGDLFLADLRDALRIRAIFEERRPQVVFHAAALKHLALLEDNPVEAFRTNVLATRDLLETALTTGVQRFVNISTDKAAAPISVLGTTKRLTERLTSHIAQESGRNFVSVRFGNVLGSRGSALDTFREQIEQGVPVTVTAPDVTRFFMTIGEAVQLVIQAAAIGRPGEALVLDMGDPIAIIDVVRRLAAVMHQDPEIVYTGLRPGEKLHEVLLAEGETDDRPSHPLVSQVPVPPLAPGDLDALLTVPADRLAERLSSLCAATPRQSPATSLPTSPQDQ